MPTQTDDTQALLSEDPPRVGRRDFIKLVVLVVALFFLGLWDRLMGGSSVRPEDTTPAPSLAQVGFGAYLADRKDWPPNIAAMESGMGRKLDLVLDYANWATGADALPEPDFLDQLGGRPLEWTIQPAGQNTYKQAPASNVVNWANLIAGDYDDRLRGFAAWVNHHVSDTLFVRFAHEMNGQGWYEWQVGGACGVTSGADYVAGFDHVAQVLKAASPKIKMVWAVNVGYDNVAQFYPDECDVMGMDGYNNVSGTSWLTVPEVFSSTYDQIIALSPDKPVWICETACTDPRVAWSYADTTYPAEPEHSKAQWVESLFDNNAAYTRITAVVWFNVQKERDWIWNSSSQSMRAFQKVMAGLSAGSPFFAPTTGALKSAATSSPVPVITSVTPARAPAGASVTVHGSGFAASQGASYLAFQDGAINWGAPGNQALFTIQSWANNAIVFIVPEPSGTDGEWAVKPGDTCSVQVHTAGGVSAAETFTVGDPGTGSVTVRR